MNALLDKDRIKSTLFETSKDDDGNAVVDFQNVVYDFDIITNDIADVYRVKKPQKSCDALYIKDYENIYLIEFKNARKSRVSKKELQQKAYDSIMTLQLAFFPEYSLNDLKKKVVLVVVYNDNGIVEKEQDSASFDALKDKLNSFTKGGKSILFNLEVFQGVLYKEVFTLEKQEYSKVMHQKIFDM